MARDGRRLTATLWAAEILFTLLAVAGGGVCHWMSSVPKGAYPLAVTSADGVGHRLGVSFDQNTELIEGWASLNWSDRYTVAVLTCDKLPSVSWGSEPELPEPWLEHPYHPHWAVLPRPEALGAVDAEEPVQTWRDSANSASDQWSMWVFERPVTDDYLIYCRWEWGP